MVQIQWLTGMRPSELCRMTVEDIEKTRVPGLWHYVLKSHKTEEVIGEKVIPLGKSEQALLAPYLTGKSNEAALFSPKTAVIELNAERRKNRKSKITPSQCMRGANDVNQRILQIL
jgi:integrase